ncbi:MAG: sugar phosphate nucleotidyltransferase [Chitinophagales bacterium]
MSDLLRKAVIPIAGFGTRMLPLSKAVPKELLPINGLPVVHHVVAEAVAAGCEQILFISRPGKRAVENYFREDPALEKILAEKGQLHLLESLIELRSRFELKVIDQEKQNGLGDAIACAKDFVGNDHFAVLLGDAILYSDEHSVLSQMLDVHKQHHASVIAVEEVPMEKVIKYGIVGGLHMDSKLVDVNKLVEKPSPEDSPSNLAVAARYILSPAIFDYLEKTGKGKGGELQISDALHKMAQSHKIIALKFAGKRLDIGNPEDFLEANNYLHAARNRKNAEL